MRIYARQQLLITPIFAVCVLLNSTSFEAEALGQRQHLKEAALIAGDDVGRELDRARTVLDAALYGKDATKWSATPPDVPTLLGQIGKGLTLPALPSSPVPAGELPSDAAAARKKVSELVVDIASRRDLLVLLADEPAFGSAIFGRLAAADNKLVDLSERFERLGHKLSSSYAQALGYSDVDQVVSRNKPVISDLRARAQNHGARSESADKELRQDSRPVLSIASSLLQKEGLRLDDERRSLDELVSSTAAAFKKTQLEDEFVSSALKKNFADVGTILVEDRALEAKAVMAAKRMEETGSEADAAIAKAARQDLKSFRQGLPAALAKLGKEKEAILVRRDANASAREQLQKTAAAAHARYKVFETQQAGHDADEATVKGISF